MTLEPFGPRLVTPPTSEPRPSILWTRHRSRRHQDLGRSPRRNRELRRLVHYLCTCSLRHSRDKSILSGLYSSGPESCKEVVKDRYSYTTTVGVSVFHDLLLELEVREVDRLPVCITKVGRDRRSPSTSSSLSCSYPNNYPLLSP